MEKIAIIGSGSWGMALANHIAENGYDVNVWSFSEEERDLINNKRKCKFLPDLKVNENIKCMLDIEDVVKDAKVIFHVTPSKFTRETFKKYKQFVGTTPVIICSKGFEKDTLKTLDEVLKDEKQDIRLGVLTGPSHAEEVSKKMATLLVVASNEQEIIDYVTKILMNDIIRIYSSDDIRGTLLGGALKNIIAFSSGIADSLGLGDNAFAALITRGLEEISRIGEKAGGNKNTFYGLSGLGDLVVTCLSEHSRNRRAGKLIGQGKTIQEAKNEVGMVIEALDNIEVAYELSKIYDLDSPIINSVYDILYNNLEPKTAILNLIRRTQKSE